MRYIHDHEPPTPNEEDDTDESLALWERWDRWEEINNEQCIN